MTLIPWRNGKALIWDATVIDTLAPSYLQQTSRRAGAAAEVAEDRKNSKYQAFLNSHVFVPVAMETMGPMNDKGLELVSDIGRLLAQVTGDSRETSFLHQRLSVTVQRFNAVAFGGTMATIQRDKRAF
jgi:hypothetical protein